VLPGVCSTVASVPLCLRGVLLFLSDTSGLLVSERQLPVGWPWLDLTGAVIEEKKKLIDSPNKLGERIRAPGA
jgi:hypothetical protein